MMSWFGLAGVMQLMNAAFNLGMLSQLCQNALPLIVFKCPGLVAENKKIKKNQLLQTKSKCNIEVIRILSVLHFCGRLHLFCCYTK